MKVPVSTKQWEKDGNMLVARSTVIFIWTIFCVLLRNKRHLEDILHDLLRRSELERYSFLCWYSVELIKRKHLCVRGFRCKRSKNGLFVLLFVADRNAVCYYDTEIRGDLSLCHKLLGGHFLNAFPWRRCDTPAVSESIWLHWHCGWLWRTAKGNLFCWSPSLLSTFPF